MTTRRRLILGCTGLTLAGSSAVLAAKPVWRRALLQFAEAPVASPPQPTDSPFAKTEPWATKLITAAESQIGQTLWYDPSYSVISYPGGDVPLSKGVCTDVIVRAYRAGLGVDLQKAVHEDMVKAFSVYPANWGLKKPDRNIDHRRVPNLQVFFNRKGASLPISSKGADYLPGDVVTMNVPGKRPHIALVTHRASNDRQRPLCVHNIGAGARLDDVLFAFELTGHYRLKPS
jgi:uncharacterized protein